MQSKRINILAISGSLKNQSSNTSILKAIAGLAPQNSKVTIYQGISDLPYFTPELNDSNPPESVKNFRTQLNNAKGVIICTPEYAYGMPGVLKNALDWTVSSEEFVNKPVVILSTSPSPQGAEKAYASLHLTLEALSSNIIEAASFTIPFALKKINPKGELSDLSTRNQLGKSLTKLIDAINND